VNGKTPRGIYYGQAMDTNAGESPWTPEPVSVAGKLTQWLQ